MRYDPLRKPYEKFKSFVIPVPLIHVNNLYICNDNLFVMLLSVSMTYFQQFLEFILSSQACYYINATNNHQAIGKIDSFSYMFEELQNFSFLFIEYNRSAKFQICWLITYFHVAKEFPDSFSRKWIKSELTFIKKRLGSGLGKYNWMHSALHFRIIYLHRRSCF